MYPNGESIKYWAVCSVLNKDRITYGWSVAVSWK